MGRQKKQLNTSFLYAEGGRQRVEFWGQSSTRRYCLSFYLGGKNSGDITPWKPDMYAVRATIKFAISIGRLDPGNQEQHTQFSLSQFY